MVGADPFDRAFEQRVGIVEASEPPVQRRRHEERSLRHLLGGRIGRKVATEPLNDLLVLAGPVTDVAEEQLALERAGAFEGRTREPLCEREITQ
jgi:hypothetical protein